MKKAKIILLLCGVLVICLLAGNLLFAVGNLLHDEFSSGAGNWTANEGTCVIESGEYSLQNLSGAAASFAGQTTWTDYSYEADLKTVGGEYDTALTFRVQNPTNLYCLAIRSSAWSNLYNNNRLELYKQVNGTWTSLAVAQPVISDNTFYHYKIVLKGSSIKVYFNRELSPRINISDSTFSSGKVGVRTWKSHGHFDNVDVYAIKNYKASDGFSTTTQGFDNWYYKDWDGSTYQNMTYDTTVNAWKGRSNYAYIGWNGAGNIHPGDATDSVRTFLCPVAGSIVITGDVRKQDISGGDGVKVKILKNSTQVWPATGWQDIAYNDSVGYDVNVPVTVAEGDEIRFVVNRNGNISNDSTYWNPLVNYSYAEGANIHYKQTDHYIGDVHPYYENGYWFLYYLKPGTFGSMLVKSNDLLNWQPATLSHGSPEPFQPYYTLGVFKDGNTYRSYYGNGTVMKGSESTNLSVWTNASSAYDIPNNISVYAAGARDPYVFYDPDNGTYRCVSTAYRVNQDWGIGTGIDCSVALTTAVSGNLTQWGTQTDMIRYQNSGVPASSAQEPECSQMFKIGNRWYLMASIARQSVHWVGKPTYWIGNSNTQIDSDNWSSKTAYTLEGEDLCAAQMVNNGAKWIMLGWIPQQATGNAWGGHVNLPREVYQLADGRLATRLESSAGSKIKGGKLFPAVGNSTITAEQGSWTLNSNTASLTGSGFGIAKLSGTYSRVDMEFNVTMDTSCTRSGLLIDKDASGPYGYEVTLDKANNLIRIRKDSGGGNWTNFSELPVASGDLSGVNNVRIIIEGDILEMFVNDKYSLCARISKSLSGTGIRLFAADGGVNFSNVNVCRLNTLETLNN